MYGYYVMSFLLEGEYYWDNMLALIGNLLC